MAVAGAYGRQHPADPSGGSRVLIDAPRYTAGETLTGRVAGALEGAPVALVRSELRPRGERVFVVARGATTGPDGAFAIAVPDTALPTAAGSRCSLAYRVQAGALPAAVEIEAAARPHLDASPRCRVDRLIPNWDARRFHEESALAWIEP